jgi:hypothetical protein
MSCEEGGGGRVDGGEVPVVRETESREKKVIDYCYLSEG